MSCLVSQIMIYTHQNVYQMFFTEILYVIIGKITQIKHYLSQIKPVFFKSTSNFVAAMYATMSCRCTHIVESFQETKLTIK